MSFNSRKSEFSGQTSCCNVSNTTWIYLNNINISTYHIISYHIISTLTRRVGTCSLWCALNARIKNILEKLDLRRRSMCTSINKAGYGHLRMRNSNMQSLILSKSVAFCRIWMRCLLQTFSSCNFQRLEFGATVNTKMEFFDQVTLYFGNANQCTSSRGKSFVQRIAIMERGSLVDLGSRKTSKIENFVAYCQHIGAYLWHLGLPKTSKMESFSKLVLN